MKIGTEIEDPNDADGDTMGLASFHCAGFFEKALTDKRWLSCLAQFYSNLVGDWLYYASSSNGVMMVWSNYDKNYISEFNNASWQKN